MILNGDRKFYQLKFSKLNYETETSTKFIIALLEKYGNLIESFYLNEVVIDAKLLIAIFILIPNVKGIFINSCTIINSINSSPQWMISASLKFRKLKSIDIKRFQLSSADKEDPLRIYDFFKEARNLEKINVSNCQWDRLLELLSRQVNLKILNIYASPGEEIFTEKVDGIGIGYELQEFSLQGDLPEETQLKNFNDFLRNQNQLKYIKIVIASSLESGTTKTFNDILTRIFGSKSQSIQLIMFPHNLSTKVLTTTNPHLQTLSIRFIWMETNFLMKMVSCYPNIRTLNLQYYGDIDTNQVILLNSLEHLKDLSLKRIFGFDLANIQIKNLTNFRCGPIFMLAHENIRDFCKNNPNVKELKIDSLRKTYNIDNEKLKIIVNSLKQLETLCVEADRISKLNSDSVKIILSKCKNIRRLEIRLPNHERYLNDFSLDISRMDGISKFNYKIFKGNTDFIFKMDIK
jgi:hypothetical protein